MIMEDDVMKMSKRQAYRAMALAMSAILLLAAIPAVSLFGAAAEVAFTQVSLSNFSTSGQMNGTYWSNHTATNVDGGGIRLTYAGTSASPQRYAPLNASVGFDGMELLFDNFAENTGSTFSGFGVIMQNSYLQSINPQNLAAGYYFNLYLDASNGRILFNPHRGSAAPVLTNTALLATNLADKQFTFKFLLKEDGGATFIARIYKDSVDAKSAEDVVLTQELAASDLSGFGSSLFTAPVSGSKYYVVLTPGYYSDMVGGTPSGLSGAAANNNIAYDFLGYRVDASEKNILAVEERIAALPGTITVANAEAVNKAQAAYDALSADDQAQVSNAATLTAANTALVDLLKSGLTLWNSTSAFSDDWWSATGARTFYDWGIRIAFNRGNLDPAFRAGVKSAVALDGLRMQFNNFHVTDATATDAGFGILLSKTVQADFGSNAGMLVYLDVKNGQFVVDYKGSSSSLVVSTVAAPVLQNLPNKAFTVTVSKTEDTANPYKLVVALSNGETATLNIPSTYADSAYVSGGNTCVTFTAGRYGVNGASDFTGSMYNTFDVYGFTNVKAIMTLTELINQIPAAAEVTEANAAVINEAKVVYDALGEADKSKLSAAEVEKINAAYAAFNSLVDDGYTDLTATYLHLSLVNKVTYPNASDWSNTLQYLTTTDNGSYVLYCNGNNMNPGRRQDYQGPMQLDNMEVKFNNLHYMDGATNTASGVGLSFSQWANQDFTNAGINGKGFILFIDVTNGQLIYNAPVSDTDKGYQVLLTDDLLKYENMAYTSFTVTLKIVGEELNEGKATVIIALADGRSVSATLPASYTNAYIPDGKTTFMAAMTGHFGADNAIATGNNGCQVEVVGYTCNRIDTLGAQMRSDNADGLSSLRFGSVVEAPGLTVGTDYVGDLTEATVWMDDADRKVVALGTIVARSAKALPTDLLKENVDGKYIVDCPAEKFYAVSGNFAAFTAVVTGIPKDNRDETLYSRAYLVYEDAQGAQHTVYGHVIARSVNDISNAVG